MKLKFRVTKKIALAPETVFDKVISYLTASEYLITETDSSLIVFREVDERSQANPRSDYYKRIDEGIFEIIEGTNQTTLELSYKVLVLGDCVVLIGLLIAGIFAAQGFLFLFGVFAFNFGYKLYNIYSYTLDEVLNSKKV